MRRLALLMTLLATLIYGGSFALAEIRINEIYFSEDSDNEYIELVSDTGGVESLDDVWLLLFDATHDAETMGQLDLAIDFSGFETGSNGLFLWHSPMQESEIVLPLPEAETPIHFAPLGDSGLLNGEMVLMLVEGFTGAVDYDLDADNDRLLDDAAFPWDSLLQQHIRTDIEALRRTVLNEETPQDYSIDLGFSVGGNISNEDIPAWRLYSWHHTLPSRPDGNQNPDSVVIKGPNAETGYFITQPLEDPDEPFPPILLDRFGIATAGRFNEIAERDLYQATPGRKNFYHANLFADCNDDDFVDRLDFECAGAAGVLEDLQIHTGFLAGDFNFDRSVDFADFLVLSSNFGEAGLYEMGDANGDEFIDFADFLLLSTNFSASQELASVPEPASIWIMLIALLLARTTREQI